MVGQKIKVIFDTNIWISYLIGQRLKILTELISQNKIQIITSDQLLRELEEVTTRNKFKKYFNPSKVYELLKFLKIIGVHYQESVLSGVCRDPKDDFLLGLIINSKADYLVTGDKDLLELNPFEETTICTIADFEKSILT